MFTQSSIKKFQNCEYQYKQRYIDLYRNNEEGAPLVLGTLVHAGLESFLLGEPLEVATGRIKSESEHFLLCEDSPLQEQAIVLLCGYYKRYKELHKRYTTISVEQEFTMQFGGHTVGGKFDGVMQDNDTGEIILIEHKTCGDWTAKSKMGTYWQQRMNAFDTQLVIYQEALRRQNADLRPPRIIYDVIFKDKSKMKDPDKMLEFYMSDNAPYYREELIYTPQDRARALKEYELLCGRIQDRINDGLWLRNTNACRKGWGMCEYFKVCQGLETLDGAENLNKVESAHPELPTTMEDKNE